MVLLTERHVSARFSPNDIPNIERGSFGRAREWHRSPRLQLPPLLLQCLLLPLPERLPQRLPPCLLLCLPLRLPDSSSCSRP